MSPSDAAIEREADKTVRDPAGDARRLLYRERHGVLSTLSVRRAGYPYGSVTPYGLSRRGTPIVLISTIAAHTKNLTADPRACLFVQERNALDDPQAGGRISVLGLCRPVPEAERPDAWARYLCRFPRSHSYQRTHDFVLYQLEPEEVRLIGGFGKICWLDGQGLLRDPEKDPLAPFAAGICQHMNQDHAEALLAYCRGLAGLGQGSEPGLEPVESAAMVGVDGLGFDVVAEPGARRIRFEFDSELERVDEVRKAMVALVGRARDALLAARG